MIQKNGGLKAGEDKWLGLSEWLAEKGKSKDERGKSLVLTKQEVLDYIKANQIEIEEVNYGVSHEEDIADYEQRLVEEAVYNPTYDALDREFSQLKYEEEEQVSRLADEYESETGEDYEWNHFEIYSRAYDKMVERHGEEFREAFKMWSEDYSLIPRDPSKFAEYLGIDTATPNEQQIDSTRLQYTTEGLENKKEIASVVPSVEPYNAHDEIHFGDAGDGRAVAWVRFGETTDAEGNRVLVIDEIQSKRHQDGREKGYRGANTSNQIEEAKRTVAEAERKFAEFREAMKEKYDYNSLVQGTAEERHEGRRNWKLRFTPEEMIKYDQLHDATIDARNTLDAARQIQSRVPDAPFEKNWHELAMKRMLRYAAENGFDKVAWTTGAQQAERYNIGKQVDEIKIYDIYDGQYNVVGFKDGQRVFSADTENGEQGLAEVLGKEMARKAYSNFREGETEYLDENGNVSFKGDNLSIGGEGMKGFYDKMLPSFMNKYGKKWGVKVGEVTMPNLGDGGLTMHSIDVTDAMKESVMEGQPMFREGEGDNSQLKIKNSQLGSPSQDNSQLPFAGVSDAEISFANDPVAKVMGRSQRSKKQQAKFAERERKYMRNRVAELTERLGIGDRVTVIENGELRVES